MEFTGPQKKIFISAYACALTYAIGSSKKFAAWNQCAAKFQSATFLITNAAIAFLRESQGETTTSKNLLYLSSSLMIFSTGILSDLDWKTNACMTTLFVLEQCGINQLNTPQAPSTPAEQTGLLEVQQSIAVPSTPDFQAFRNQIQEANTTPAPLPYQLLSVVHSAYTLITISEITKTEGFGSIYLGSFEAVDSLRNEYTPEDPFYGSAPEDSGYPPLTDCPESLQVTLAQVYSSRKKVTAANLTIHNVVTVGYSDVAPSSFLRSNINSIYQSNLSEMSHEDFMNDFKKAFPTIYPEVRNSILNRRNVLIHCNSGEHRSPIVTIALVMRLFDVTKEEAINWVRSKRPVILPNNGVKLQNLETALDWVNEQAAQFPSLEPLSEAP